ncbi:hypothetical protein AB0B11_00615 [Micromonospora tulbaghiae]|uniref:hypothetical protein n=1 Tax=Micromonospora tulbaghiae TaxID=479978 RepID=UPI0033F64B00
MTTEMADAAQPVMETGARRSRAGSEPPPVPWRRRRALARSGRRDGRFRRPDPLLLTAPAQTATRVLLHAEFQLAVATAYADFTTAAEPHRRALRRVRAELPLLHDNLAALESALAAAEARHREAGAGVERRMGERFQPEELIRARRAREHARRLDPQRRARDQARAEIQAAQRRLAELRVRIDGLFQHAVGVAWRLRARCSREQALYDEALLRRHPDGDLLRDLLDTRPPDLPRWVHEPAEAHRMEER